MAGLVQIFVEGDGDVKFISDYITHIIPNATAEINKLKAANINIDGFHKIKVQGLGGWTDIQNVKPEIQRNKDDGGVNSIIFDADTIHNNGGFAKRKQDIENKITGLDCEIFLFPNNQDDGALEDLLEHIIKSQNVPIFECWDKFEACLKNQASPTIGKDLTFPAKKSKIYVYLEALLGKTNEEKKKIKDPNRDYNNADLWDLDVDYLKPLKEFIIKQL
jgi:hypothetical protein